MILKDINLLNFRNYSNLSLSFSPNINIIYGNNAQGKTNLLESIYVLGLTKSHRSFIDQNLIREGEENSIIKGKIEEENIKSTLEINIKKKEKKIKVDNKNINSISNYIEKMNIIIFYPEDLELIKGSPSIRRKFINLELSQLQSNYLVTLTEYNKLLKIRNEYLKKIQQQIDVDFSYFKIITDYLIEKSIILYQSRNRFIDKLNSKCRNIYKDIIDIGNFYIKYITSLEFQNYEKEYLREKIREKFKQVYKNEVKLGTTLIGPHRDDIEFYIEDFNLKNYGSQGQQRIAVLSLKLSEIEIYKEWKDNYPILLLDDVFSELDDQKKNNLLLYINEKIQTIITTTELNNIDDTLLKKAKIIKIANGTIEKTEEV